MVLPALIGSLVLADYMPVLRVAAGLSNFMFGDIPDCWTTPGMLLIAAAGAFIAWPENLKPKPGASLI